MFYLINRTFTKNNSMYEVICVDEGSNPSWSTISLFNRYEMDTVNVVRENSIDFLTRAILDLRRKGSKYVKCYYINSTGNYNVVDYTHVA